MVHPLRVFLVGALLFCGSATAVLAQVSAAELPARARAMGLTLALPSLEDLRFDTTVRRLHRSDFHLHWRHRGPGFEIYATLVPEAAGASPMFPNVLGGAAVTNVAVNAPEEEHFVALYRAGDDDLERLNADWAAFWAFTPQPELSGRDYGYQATYYKEGRGLVHLYVFADDRAVVNGDWAYVLPFE